MEAARMKLPDLRCAGLSEEEAGAVQRCGTREEQLRFLRRARGSMLEELHRRQQTLDRLDYLIYRLSPKKTGGRGA